MITPQEIQKKVFSRVKFGGYDMSMVDEFLDTVYEDYSALYKDSALLKSKMKVLIDKIEEYRSVDDAMRKTLLSAQNMANEIIANAKKQSDEMTALARADAERQIAGYRVEAEQFKLKLEQARREAGQLIDSSIRACSGSMSMLETLKNELAPKADIIAPEITEALQHDSSTTATASYNQSEPEAKINTTAETQQIQQKPSQNGSMEDTTTFDVELSCNLINT